MLHTDCRQNAERVVIRLAVTSRPKTKFGARTVGNVFTRVCHSVHEGGSLSGGTETHLQTETPRTVKSGRYASYWNAFLFTCCKESPGRYLPACLIAHTGTRSVTSPLAARSIKSFFKGGKG